jgi:hypothetical protein
MQPFIARKQRQSATPRPTHFRPAIEALEDRCVPALLMALDQSSHLLVFDSSTPGTIVSEVSVSGLQAGDELRSIRFRPSTGGLYGLATGIAAPGQFNTYRLYTLDPNTGAATLVSPAAGFGDADINNPYFDFDPFTDQIRLNSGPTLNWRVSPVTGTVIAEDTPIRIGGANEIAYAPPVPGIGGPTLYGLIGFDGSGHFSMIGSPGGSPDSANTGIVTTVTQLKNLPAVGNVIGLAIVAGADGGADTAFTTVNFIESTADGWIGFGYLVSIDPASGATTTIGRINDSQQLSDLIAEPGQTVASTGGGSSSTGGSGGSGGLVPPAAAPPVSMTPSQQFVTQVFQSLLGRNPDQNSLTTLATFLDQGAINQYQFILAVEQSPEYLGRAVNQMYRSVLGRAADPSGQQAGTLFLEAGGTPDGLKALLYGSPEFYQKAGRNDPAFLAALFGDVTGQSLDTAMFNALDGLLNSGTPRAAVARMLLAAVSLGSK